MARAQFQKGQKVWVESVGVWAEVERVVPVWAKGFDEPVRVSYEVGLGREFQGNELHLPESDALSGNLGSWRVMRARNKWQEQSDCSHHPFPGSYPVVVTDDADWGGWRVPGAEYDRQPEKIEQQARIISMAPHMLAIMKQLIESVDENPMDAPPEARRLAEASKAVMRRIQSQPLPSRKPAMDDADASPALPNATPSEKAA
jgi:hypothetical protein